MSATLPREKGMGWIRDYPDIRDLTPTHPQIAPFMERLGLSGAGLNGPPAENLPSSVDLRQWCSPIEDQGALSSCTANAAAALYEYFERRAYGKHIDVSRLFIYKTTRNLLGWKEDKGAYVRTTLGSLALFGAPPEKYWPYDPAKVNEEPDTFTYNLGNNFRALKYVKLDMAGTPSGLLSGIKLNLAAKLPAIFGFSVYSSIVQAGRTGKIPFPAPGDKLSGGHAIMAVGYDDRVKVVNPMVGGKETIGALLIRNSWGTQWGDGGYGWLPYEYVLQGLAVDWWTLLSADWLDTAQFGI